MIIWIIICTRTRGKETALAIQIYLFSSRLFYCKNCFLGEIREGEGGRPVGIQRVSRRTKSWKYKRFSLALHKSHSRITLPHRRNSNGGFPTPDESNFPGRGWWRALNILSPPPGTFSAAKDPSVIPIGADQIMHDISRPEISPLPCCNPVMELKLILCGAVNGQTKFCGSSSFVQFLERSEIFPFSVILLTYSVIRLFDV